MHELTVVNIEKENVVVKVRGLRISKGTFTFYHAAFWTVCLSYREKLLMSYLGDLNVNTKVM